MSDQVPDQIGTPASKPAACKSECAPSSEGCIRCQSVSTGEIPANTSAILFGPQDSDADATLRAALKGTDFECADYGPLLMVKNVRDRLGALAAIIHAKLSIYTQSCIQAAFTPSAIGSVNQMLGIMAYSMPLSEMVQDIEHEWVRTALNDHWLFSVFHPIIHAQSGEVYANEALLRARNPVETKVLGAGQIINACERLNLMHQLDQRARQTAIRAASEHLPKSSRVFINFLPNTIYDPEICLRTTMQAAADCNLSMDRLVFEVVETEKIPDMDHLCRVLNYYRDRGVGTAIDDMGAGFTSLDYISSLKPEFVKLDREFVLCAEATTDGRRAMDSIISASHASGARVIAEGIETTAQMALCANAGVDLLQGFLFAKPACPPQKVNFPVNQRNAA